MFAWHAEENVLVNQNMANPANLANPANPENPSTPNVLMENAQYTKLSSGNFFSILVDLHLSQNIMQRYRKSFIYTSVPAIYQ